MSSARKPDFVSIPNRWMRFFSKDLSKTFGLLYLAIALPAAQIWHENSEYFGFSVVEFIAAPLAVALPLFAIAGIAALLGADNRTIKLSALWLLAVGSMVVFLVPHNFSVIDGNQAVDIESREFGGLIISTLVVGIILIFLLRKRSERGRNLQRIGGILGTFVILFSGGFLAFALVAAEKTIAFTESSKVLPLELSSQQNVFVISFDQVQSTLVREYFVKYPEARAEFPGFLFFQDTVTPYPNTNYALSSVYLGRLPASAKENVHAAFRNGGSLPAILGSSGWQVRAEYLITDDVDTLAASFNWEGPLEAVRHGVNKAFGVMIPLEYVAFLSGRPHTPSLSWKQDLEDFQAAIESVQVSNSGRSAHFYHLLGTHQPFSYDRDCTHLSIEQTADRQNVAGAEDTLECSVKLMRDFVGMLQTEGLYESSTIIFFSDHGYEGNINQQLVAEETIPTSERVNLNETGGPLNIKPLGTYMPFLMAKPPNASKNSFPLIFSDFPASLVDIAPTICGQVGCTAEWDGLDLLSPESYGEPVDRRRAFWLFEGALRKPFQFHESLDFNWTRREFSGQALERLPDAMANYSPIPDGGVIDFSESGNSLGYLLAGWSGQEEKYRWSDGLNAAVGFSADFNSAEFGAVVLQINGFGFTPAGRDSQIVRVTANGFPVGGFEAGASGIFEVIIPTSRIVDGKIRINFEFPEAARPCEVSESQDCRLLGLGVTSMSIGYSEVRKVG
jgi:hypothetical protein